jgi:crotonobetainyl-CoA:carnitine CoA-transferase CaiB-like acyl-CoA transferase
VAQREVAAQVLLLGGGRQHRQAGMAVDLTLLAEAARRSGLLAGDRTTCCHYTRLPFQLAGLPHRYGTDAPRFGADTREVLGEQAGLSTSVIDRLFASGVVR